MKLVEFKSLKKTSVFKNFTNLEFKNFCKMFEILEFQEGDEIVRKGYKRKGMYFILDGEVEVLEDILGVEEKIAILGTGYFFGEIGIIKINEKIKYTVKSASFTKLAFLSYKKFNILLKKNYKLGLKFLKNIIFILEDRLMHANNKILTFYNTGKILSLEKEIPDLIKGISKVIFSVIRASKIVFIIRRLNTIKFDMFLINRNGLSQTRIISYEDPIVSYIYKIKELVNFNTDEYKEFPKKVDYIKKNFIGVPLIIEKNFFGIILLIDKQNAKGFSYNNEILIDILSKQISYKLFEISKIKEEKEREKLKWEFIKPI